MANYLLFYPTNERTTYSLGPRLAGQQARGFLWLLPFQNQALQVFVLPHRAFHRWEAGDTNSHPQACLSTRLSTRNCPKGLLVFFVADSHFPVWSIFNLRASPLPLHLLVCASHRAKGTSALLSCTSRAVSDAFPKIFHHLLRFLVSFTGRC